MAGGPKLPGARETLNELLRPFKDEVRSIFADDTPKLDPEEAAFYAVVKQEAEGSISHEEAQGRYEQLPERFRRPGEPIDEGALGYILILATAVLIYLGFVALAAILMLNLTSVGMSVPGWWFAISVVLASAAGLASMVGRDLPAIRKRLRGLRKRGQHPMWLMWSPIWLPLLVIALLLFVPQVRLER
jgi:hypothetical protein